MEIKTVIIDDELPNVENLQTMLEKWCAGIHVAGTATGAAEGIEVIRRLKPDLVFLDIQMPDGSGFDVLRAFSGIDFEVIFVTAYDQYGIQAIKFSALDYLLKPVDVFQLQEATAKARAKLTARDKNQNISNLLEYIRKAQADFPKIALPTAQETHFVTVNRIIRCEASNNYTTFYILNHPPVLVSKTLKEFEELLAPHSFQRVHQSHLVNFMFVRSLLKEDGGALLLDDGARVPVSRQNLEKVKKALMGVG